MTEGSFIKPKLACLARGLTLARILAIPAFLWVFFRLESAPDLRWRMLLIAVYAYAILSDLTDGPLARRAGGVRYFWGLLDAFSDVAFNAAALSAAAWTGRVGPWAPLGVLALGAQFLWRCRGGAGSAGDSLPEDEAGKWAGVFFYALVGVVVLETAFSWNWLKPVLPWLGRLVFLYALYLLIRNARLSQRRL